MKKIALDLDGVMFDTENLYRVYTEIYDVEINKKDTIIDNAQRIFQKRYNWSREEMQRFYDKYAEKVLKSANFMAGVDLVLNRLKEKFEIIIVTSRNDFETNIAKEKLNKIGFKNIEIFNNEQYKIDRLLNEHADYVIDDEDVCINAASNNICALYFKNNASNKVQEENITNVNNWGEVYKYLMLKENN